MTDTPSRVEPAMPPEEWAAQLANIDTLKSRLHHAVGEVDQDGWLDRHGLAALALYGRPFGFTREDVVMLRQVQIADYREEWRRAFDSLADRIEALLPPEQETDG